MQFALIQVCVDDRLDHNLLRAQIRARLAALHIHCEHVFIVNEPGGNMGENFKNTVAFVKLSGAQVALAAVLHHDDCRAAQVGLRRPLEATVAQMAAFLAQSQIDCVLLSGQIDTASNAITWQHEQGVTRTTWRA